MLTCHRSNTKPFDRFGPLAGFKSATGDEPDLPQRAAQVAAALELYATEQVASLVMGKTPDGRWGGIRKTRRGDYEWAVWDEVHTPLLPRATERPSAMVVINEPTNEDLIRRAQEILNPPIDSILLAQECDSGLELRVEIAASGEP